MQPLINFTGRYFGYARVSTDDQNLDLQVRALVGAGVPEDMIFSEKRSGKNMERPQWKKLLRAARPGDCIMVWKLDRLGRSMVGVLDTIQYFKENDIHFRVLQDNIDTTTPMGSFIMHLFAAIAQLERDLISQRTQAGVDAAKKRGVVFGRQHYILAHPKRLAAFHDLATKRNNSGTNKALDYLPNLSPVEIINRMNAADRKAPQYKHPQSYINWYSKGFPGLKEALKLMDLPMPKSLPKPKKRKPNLKSKPEE